MHVVTANVEEMKVFAGCVRVHALPRELLQVGELEVLQALDDLAGGVHQAGQFHSCRYGGTWSHGGESPLSAEAAGWHHNSCRGQQQLIFCIFLAATLLPYAGGIALFLSLS